MAQHAIASPPKKVTRGETRPKIVTDDGRRDRFKGRAKDLERGISAPSLFSDEGEVKAGPKAPLPLTQQETITVGLGLGHDFAKKTFFQPTYCHYCSDMMWGFKGQGYMCTGGLLGRPWGTVKGVILVLPGAAMGAKSSEYSAPWHAASDHSSFLVASSH